jgi:hypothetical protein
MDLPEQARRWQDRFDRLWPDGVTVGSAVDPPGNTYPVARPEVVGMRGVDPVVFLEMAGWDRNMSGVITGWEEVRDAPHQVVRVTLDLGPGKHTDDVQLWGGVSPAQAHALAALRRESLRLSAEGALFRYPHYPLDPAEEQGE